jgi:hypothetical protein
MDAKDFWSFLEHHWNHNRVVAWVLVLAAIGLALWAKFWPQSPGVSIGLLALVAGIMSIRPDMHPAEKFAWVVVLVAFTILEVLAIGRSDKDSKDARDSQNQEFQAIAGGLKTEDDGLKKAIEQTTAHAIFSDPHATLVGGKLGVAGQFVIDLHVFNVGYDVATEVELYGGLYFGNPKDKSTEGRLAKQFEADWKKAEARGAFRLPNNVAPGAETWSSFPRPAISAREMQKLNGGKDTVYQFSRVSYNDQTGAWYSDGCVYWQVPLGFALPALPQGQIVTNPCATFRNYRYHSQH